MEAPGPEEPGAEEEVVPPPPPPPLEPLLDVTAPAVRVVRSDSALLEWQQASDVCVPRTDDPAQLEVQERFAYALRYELQMQEVIGIPAGTADPEAAAASRIDESKWAPVLDAPTCSSAEVRTHGGRVRAGGARAALLRQCPRADPLRPARHTGDGATRLPSPAIEGPPVSTAPALAGECAGQPG